MPFAMAKERMQLNWKEDAGKQAGQILLEGDMIVPDSKPDLQEILRCEGLVKIREKRISEERVSFSGELEICVLYRAKNGEKSLYAMKTSLPIEDFLHMEGLDRDMEVSLTGELEHLDCQIINDRKIGVKAVIRMEGTAKRNRQADVLTDVSGDGMERLKGNLRMEQETAEGKDRFNLREEITVPVSRPEIGDILTEHIRLIEQEIRPLEGRAAVRGNLCISLLYTDENGNLGSLTEKIPFSGQLEHQDIHPKTNLQGELMLEEWRLTPSVDEDGESRQIHVDATIGAVLRGTEMVEQMVLQDAYGREGEVLLKKETIFCPVTAAEGRNQFAIRERIQLENEEIPMLQTEMVWGDVRLLEAETQTDGLEAEGVLSVDILYHCADDGEPVQIIRRNIPFRQMLEMKGVRPEDEAEVRLRLEDVDFQMLSEREGELRGTVIMEATVKRQEPAEVVQDVVWTEKTEDVPLPGAVIYMVQNGDSLWKIAKKYRTTVDNIATLNEIEDVEMICPGQKLLLIKMAD